MKRNKFMEEKNKCVQITIEFPEDFEGPFDLTKILEKFIKIYRNDSNFTPEDAHWNKFDMYEYKGGNGARLSLRTIFPPARILT